MPVFQSRVDPASEEFATNRDEMLALVDEVRALAQRAEDTSEARRERFAARGQLTPRQRVAYLLDPGAPFLELGNLRGYLVDDENPDTSLPGGSSIVGIGFVAGTRVLVVWQSPDGSTSATLGVSEAP